MRVKCKSWMKGGRGVRDVSVICVRQCVYHMCTYVPPLPPSHAMDLQGLSLVLMYLVKWNGWLLEVRTGQLQFGNCKYIL